jgi:hypothetical protein
MRSIEPPPADEGGPKARNRTLRAVGQPPVTPPSRQTLKHSFFPLDKPLKTALYSLCTGFHHLKPTYRALTSPERQGAVFFPLDNPQRLRYTLMHRFFSYKTDIPRLDFPRTSRRGFFSLDNPQRLRYTFYALVFFIQNQHTAP